MITLRMMSTALLWNKHDELLMMKRALTRTLSPGLWAAIGGHLEPHEISQPRTACFVKYGKKQALSRTKFKTYDLQYVLLRLNGQEIRQQFFYVGKTDVDPRIVTSEGDLHWIPKASV